MRSILENQKFFLETEGHVRYVHSTFYLFLNLFIF